MMKIAPPEHSDIRWLQRLTHFEKAMTHLQEGVDESARRELNNLEKQGLIQAFEYCYELAWKTVKDFYEAQGETTIQGSRDAFRLAFGRGLVSENGHVLMETIRARAMTSHTYDEAISDEIRYAIIQRYKPAFDELLQRLISERTKRTT
ncbi:MAG: nucleotidyltransferase substrate binding protein [Thermoguttaceae bacterium]